MKYCQKAKRQEHFRLSWLRSWSTSRYNNLEKKKSPWIRWVFMPGRSNFHFLCHCFDNDSLLYPSKRRGLFHLSPPVMNLTLRNCSHKVVKDDFSDSWHPDAHGRQSQHCIAESRAQSWRAWHDSGGAVFWREHQWDLVENCPLSPSVMHTVYSGGSRWRCNNNRL